MAMDPIKTLAKQVLAQFDKNRDQVIDKNDNLDKCILEAFGVTQNDDTYSYDETTLNEMDDDKLIKILQANLQKQLDEFVPEWEQSAKRPEFGIKTAQAPSYGNVVAVKNNDGTSYSINLKEHTIKKYDADGQVIELRSMNEEEQALSTNDLIKQLQASAESGKDANSEMAKQLEEPWQAYPTQTTQKPQYKDFDTNQNDVKSQILKLKPGESIQYTEKGYRYEGTVTVVRNDDGTISEFRASNVRCTGYPRFKAVRLETKYDKDYNKKLSEDFVDNIKKSGWGVKSTKFYDDKGKIAKIETDLTGFDKGCLDRQTLKILLEQQNSSFEIHDKDGTILLKYENGNYYNSNNRAILKARVSDKLSKYLLDRNTDGLKLIENPIEKSKL